MKKFRIEVVRNEEIIEKHNTDDIVKCVKRIRKKAIDESGAIYMNYAESILRVYSYEKRRYFNEAEYCSLEFSGINSVYWIVKDDR